MSETDEKETISLTIPRRLKNLIESRAGQEGRSTDSFLVNIIEREIQNKPLDVIQNKTLDVILRTITVVHDPDMTEHQYARKIMYALSVLDYDKFMALPKAAIDWYNLCCERSRHVDKLLKLPK